MGGGGSKDKGGDGNAVVNNPTAATTANQNGQAAKAQYNEADLIPVTKDEFFGTNIPIGDIIYVSSIGQGAFGEVWKAVVRNKMVAVKKLFNTDQDKNEAIYDFYHETNMMKRLKHKNIVHFLGTVTKDPNYCIITELMSGCVSDLLRLCRHKEMSMTWGLTLNIARDCAEAMEYLHNMDPPMIHRDLKSENLLINEEFTGKVADFGLARFEDKDLNMTVCGTPSWVAPEVFRGEKYNHTCDVYSFSILFWELITQEKPHHGYDANELPMLVGGPNGLRPSKPNNVPKLIFDLLLDTWQDGAPSNVVDSEGNPGDPEHRPSFADIILRIEKIASTTPEKDGDNYIDMQGVVDCHTNDHASWNTWGTTTAEDPANKVDYDAMGMRSIKEECQRQGIDTTGRKEDLIANLERADNKKKDEARAARGDTTGDTN